MVSPTLFWSSFRLIDRSARHLHDQQNPVSKLAQHASLSMNSVPSRSACEMIARGLGVVSDLQAAKVLMVNLRKTLGFDATTQRVHITEIHATTATECHVISIDELPGGTSEDCTSCCRIC